MVILKQNLNLIWISKYVNGLRQHIFKAILRFGFVIMAAIDVNVSSACSNFTFAPHRLAVEVTVAHPSSLGRFLFVYQKIKIVQNDFWIFRAHVKEDCP